MKPKKIFIFLAVILCLCIVFYAFDYYMNSLTGNIISSGSVVFSEPVVLGKSVYPEKVAHGDVLLEIVFIEDEYGIESVAGEIEGIDNLTFSLIDGTVKNGTWQNAWIVHTTENMKWYNTTIIIRNVKGETTVTSLLWQDPTVYHPASEITAGTFDAGDFTFQDNVIVQDNLTIQDNVTINGQIKVTGGSPGADKVLTTDANGLATWQTPSGVPSGVIVMWSGTLASVPSGWALCNGSSGTPDLREKFIYGWTNEVNPGGTGGSSSDTYSVTRTSWKCLGVNRTDSESSSTAGDNLAIIDTPMTTTSRLVRESNWFTVGGWYSSNYAYTYNVGGFGTESKSFNFERYFVTESISHIPPYFKLAFIMKL